MSMNTNILTDGKDLGGKWSCKVAGTFAIFLDSASLREKDRFASGMSRPTTKLIAKQSN